MLESVRNVVDMVVSTVTTSHILAMLLMTCIAIYWFTHNNNNNNNKMKLPPGPPGYPIIGNILDFKGSSLIKKSLEWKEIYGPVIAFSTGPKKWIVLTSVETVTEAFVQRAADFSNRPTGHTPVHDRDQHTKRIHSAVVQCIDEMLATEGPVDPDVYIGNAIFNIIHVICYGYTRKADDPTFVQLLRASDEVVNDAIGYWEDVVPYLTYCPTRKYRQFQRYADFFLGYVNEHIEERRKVFDEKKVETLIELHANTNITDDAIKYMIFDIFTAGFETTKSTMKWVILMIATHQDVQQKIHDEIDSVLGEDTISVDRRKEFVYTEAAILEVLRLYPAVYTAVPHLTARDTQVGGYDIPADTLVATNFMAIHRDPRHWEKPDSFMPERFIEDDGKTLKPRPKSWMPFSVGPRNCIGEYLAKASLVYSLVILLQKLHFNMAPENETPDLQPQDKWTFCVCKPYKVVVTKRRA